ncbi:MAG: type IX secretion system membrane protein PorP/SprF [Chitinophagaceae bacterium]|nr:MAG: type IX secretion system membrane protein PorP/SprF [Chitinophagaceae bacterium]
MKKNLLTCVLLLSVLFGAAQQLPVFSLYDLHPTMHNPATAGVKGYASIGGAFRSQWSSVSGAPQTTIVFGDTYLPKVHLGLGGYLYNDVTGPTRRTGLQMAYSYIIRMQNEASFSLGIEGRLQQYSLDHSKIQQALSSNDPVLAGKESQFRGDAGFGVAYTHPRFQIGASVSQLIQSKLRFTDANGAPVEARNYRHFFAHGYYDWKVDEVTDIYPNFLAVYLPNAPFEFQGGVRVEHNHLFWYGLSLRARQSWMGSVGVRIKKKFNVGYSIDLYRNPVSVFINGSSAHEIMLRYDFLKK